MFSKTLNFVTLKMNQLPAFFTFAMIRNKILILIIFSNVFKTCTACSVNYIFCNTAFFHHFFQMSVNCCCSNRYAFVFKIIANLIYCHMSAFCRF